MFVGLDTYRCIPDKGVVQLDFWMAWPLGYQHLQSRLQG